MLPSARRAATGRTIVGRFPVAQSQVASFHAGAVLRDEEKAAAPVEKESFLMDTLGDWNRAVPIGVALAIPAVKLDIYMVTEETQLFCCFMLFIGSAYSLAGDALGAFLDEKRDAILKEFHIVENEQIAGAEALLESHKAVLSAAGDIEGLQTVHNQLAADMVDAHNMKLKLALRDATVAKLDGLAADEADLAASMHATIVNGATDSVTQAFTAGNKKVKTEALQYAMDALAGKSVGADSVSEMYSKFLKDYSAKMAELASSDQELSADQKAQVGEHIENLKRRFDLSDLKVETPSKITVSL